MEIVEKNDIGLIFRVKIINDKKIREKIGYINIFKNSIEL